MKRFFAVLILFSILLPGCGVKEQALFYYCNTEFLHDTQDSVIVSEKRDISAHSGDLPFLISLYLMGPLEKEYVSPFPAGVKLIDTQISADSLTITLDEINNLSDYEYTLACACMALTCMELSAVKMVTVTSGDRTITIDPNMLTLYDSGIPIESTTGG